MSLRRGAARGAALLLLAASCAQRAPSAAATPPAQPATPAPAPKVPPPAAMVPPLAEGRPSLAPLVEAVKGSVVNVEVQAARGTRTAQDELFERFFGFRGPRGNNEAPRRGSGSGVIIDPSGKVLTNNHVVEGATRIRVKLDDGRTFDAQALGRDPLTDLALLQLKGEVSGLPSARLGDSDGMRVGDWVVAIGNPFGLASSVSAGIISAKARDIQNGPYDDFLQTDAAINPGNSGGPLFNLSGEVIGINTAIIAGGGGGIGFSVPSSMAKALLPQLEKGEVRRGWLGVGIQDLTAEVATGLKVPVQKGALVQSVEEGTPAAEAGIKVDDVIVELDGEPLDSMRALTRAVGFKAPESQVKLKLYRDGKLKELEVKLGERPGGIDRIGAAPESPAAESSNSKLGVGLLPNPRGNGALVASVEPGSPAETAGLAQGMIIVEVAGAPVRTPQDAIRALRGVPSGTTMLLRVQIPEDGRRLLLGLVMP